MKGHSHCLSQPCLPEGGRSCQPRDGPIALFKGTTRADSDSSTCSGGRRWDARGRLLLEDFVNWSAEPQEIVRFTKLYAPALTEGPGLRELLNSTDPKAPMKSFSFDLPPLPPREPAKIWKPSTEKGNRSGKEFRFQLESWRNIQRGFRQFWEGVATKSQSMSFVHHTWRDAIIMRDGKLVYFAGNLESFFLMEFLSAPLDRLRTCRRPECETPYFVARHLRQQYCSPGCAEWAQAQAKKQWWSSEGKQWLNARKKSTRSTNHKQKG